MKNEYEYIESSVSIQGENFFKLDCVEEVFTRIAVKDVFAIAYLFSPDFIRIKDYIFVADFFNRYGKKTASLSEHLKKVKRLEKTYNGDRLKIEKAINSWSIHDFFCSEFGLKNLNEEYIERFGNILVEHWRTRVKTAFPDRDIVVELGYEIMGELGLTITVYQR
ncbi:MAG: hypothetical protein IJX64_07785 [Clostridia bacterium]|nr:hypothetical protein [Clostridia bacterium]